MHILRAISAAGRTRYTLMQQERSKGDQKQQRQTTRMIVVVTAVFAFCNALPLVLNVWEALDPFLFVDDTTKRMVAFFMLDISNVLVVFNSTINFMIYWIYCRQYRRIFYRSIRRRLGRKRKRILTGGDMATELDECYYPRSSQKKSTSKVHHTSSR